MVASRETVGEPPRRTVVPPAAGRSLWLAAAWTGFGAAFVCAVIAIVVVAVCWLPAAGTTGNAGSAIHAGLLTFLAGLHGGVTVDGTHAAFLPLGIALAIAAVAWRSGTALADAADDLGEHDTGRLAAAGGLQLLSFALACSITAQFATLGTSSVMPVAAGGAAVLGWLVTGSVAFARHSAIAGAITPFIPHWVATALRAAVACLAVYLASGALLSAGSLALHWHRVSTLSGQVGGGWSGVPVLLLGVLAAPNAAVAAAGYLSGAGFAVGSDTAVRLGATAHGTVPAFPLLGALPDHPASVAGWLLAAATALTAGCCVAVLARRGAVGAGRWRAAGAGAGAAGVLAAVVAWLAGGGIGDGRLATVGVSPWQFGAAVVVECGLAAGAVLGLLALGDVLRARRDEVAELPIVGRLAVLPDLIAADAEPAGGTSARSERRRPGADELAG